MLSLSGHLYVQQRQHHSVQCSAPLSWPRELAGVQPAMPRIEEKGYRRNKRERKRERERMRDR
jgi:hypothetical protein